MECPRVSSLRAWSARALAASLLTGATLAAAPGVAQAQEAGVIYEPGSPSGKEYAIPLEEARRDATGGGGQAKDSSVPFGVGITPRGGGGPGGGSGDGGSASDRGGGQGDRRTGAGRTEGRAPDGAGAIPRDLRERLRDAETASAPAIWELAPLLLVLLPGLVVGLMLARRERGQPAI